VGGATPEPGSDIDHGDHREIHPVLAEDRLPSTEEEQRSALDSRSPLR
jgi:hypothetical protein